MGTDAKLISGKKSCYIDRLYNLDNFSYVSEDSDELNIKYGHIFCYMQENKVLVKDLIGYLKYLISLKDNDRIYWVIVALLFCLSLQEDDYIQLFDENKDEYFLEYEEFEICS